MTGERLAWFRVASHLGIPVAELVERITHREFVNWLEYLGWEEGRKTKLDLYLAQIAAEIRRSYVKHPKQVKVADFFVQQKGSSEAKAKDSKSIWLSFFNLNPGDN